MNAKTLSPTLLSTLFNIVGFQFVWFLCVSGAANENVIPGIVAAIFFAALSLYLSPHKKSDITTMCLAMPLGFLMDSALVQSNLISFSYALPSGNWAPLWIMGLWLGFAFTLNHSLKTIYKKRLHLFIFGFLGAPLVYSIATFKFGAMTFNGNMLPALLAIACVWGFGLIALQYLNTWLSASQEKSSLA